MVLIRTKCCVIPSTKTKPLFKVAGRVLEPKRAVSRNESRDPAAAVSTNKCYIGSIGDLRDEELRTYFTQFGSIEEVDVQQAKHQAFITFTDHDPVDRIVSQKHTVCGIIILVRLRLCVGLMFLPTILVQTNSFMVIS